jgi:hypothetical protein
MPTKKPSRKDSWKKLGMWIARNGYRLPMLHGGGEEVRLYVEDSAKVVRRARALRAATRKKGNVK